MSIKFIVPGPNVKILARAVHSLAKLGDELYVESKSDELSFRTVNMSKTAYACFTFNTSFFSYFDDKHGAVKCQISMKSSLAVFRSPITLEKTVESCEIRLQPDGDKLIFLLKYKKGRGVIKTFHVPIIECETLQAFYVKDNAQNMFTVEAKVISNILHNFQNNQEEITLKALKNKIIIRNFSESEDILGVRTELNVDSDEFSEFKIKNENEITFCLKELRAVLSFAESVGLPLSSFFNIASKPIVFLVKNTPSFEANFVVSTLSGDASQSTQESQVVNIEPSRNEIEDVTVTNGVANDSTVQREFRHVFQRCFEKEPFRPEQIPGYDKVLVPDSDEEDGS